MATPNIFLLFTAIPLFFFFFFLSPHCYAQSPAAPAPAAAGTANLTAILVKGGQFTTFLRLLSATQVGNQIQNQLNSSTEGMTVFCPTDNAFQSLKSGTINGLSTQQQVQLVLYHVLPKFYTFATFQTASNPVRTQATGQNGGVFGLNITSVGNNQANVSSGLVETQINNALRQDFPLAVYQVDRVLLPEELFEAKSPVASPAAPEAKGKSAGGESSEAAADGPAASKDDRNGGYGARSAGWGLVVGAGLVSIGLLS